jgi:hypothetical protein
MAMTPSKIPVLLCIDVEPDPRLVNRSQPEPWIGYEFTQRYLSDLRLRIEQRLRTTVHYCWFFRMDPQIAESYGTASWAVDRYGSFIETIESHGDELGIHPHAYRWLEDKQTWLQDFGNQNWVDHCVGTSLEAFARALGRPCRSFRFGDRWHSTATVNLAERLGVWFDLTIEPGARAMAGPASGDPSTGSLPHYFRVPRRPYVPSPSDFRRPQRTGVRRIRMIPLTSGHLKYGFRLGAHARRLFDNGFRYRKQDTPLSMWKRWEPPNTFAKMLDRSLATQERAYLAFAVRTDIGANRAIFEAVDSCLNALLQHPAHESFVFCTPAEAIEILRRENYFSSLGYCL